MPQVSTLSNEPIESKLRLLEIDIVTKSFAVLPNALRRVLCWTTAPKLGCDGDITEASWKAFMNTGYGKTATSPLLAEKLAMIRPNDSYQMNRDRIYAAGIAAVNSGEGQESFHRPDLNMPGSPEFQKMVDWLVKARDEGILTPHDVVTGTEIARIMSSFRPFGKVSDSISV